MPNRIFKESLKTSPEIDQLTWFEEVVFERLILTVDDYGCFDGRVIVLRNELFPTKDCITRKNVEDAIKKLESVKLLVRYEAEGKPYIYLPTWEKHQRIRNQHRKYPAPPDVDLSADCGQLTADCLPESESESKYESESKSISSSEFDEVWNLYPRKLGKKNAFKAYLKARKNGVSQDVILQGIRKYLDYIETKHIEEQYIKYGSTWFTQGCWDDDYLFDEADALPIYDDSRNPELDESRLNDILSRRLS